MTDPVNVPREVIERLEDMARWLVEEDSDFIMSPSVAREHSADVRTLLAAAPKAGPVLDRAAIIEAVKTAMNDAWCDITSDTGCWPADLHRVSERGPVRIEYRPAIWTETTAEMVANALARPEAPKVEQEPVAWQQKLESGRWGTILHGSDKPIGPSRPLYTHPAPASDELLEALEQLVSDYESEGVTGPLMNCLRDLIAKHKGPQS